MIDLLGINKEEGFLAVLRAGVFNAGLTMGTGKIIGGIDDFTEGEAVVVVASLTDLIVRIVIVGFDFFEIEEGRVTGGKEDGCG